MDIYVGSVGHGANMNLNVPPDNRGLIHENDVASLKQLGEHLRETFAVNLADGAQISASNVRGNDLNSYGPQKLIDGDMWSAWVTDDGVKTPRVVFDLTGRRTFNMIRLRENIRLGQRVDGVAVDTWDADAESGRGAWKQIAEAQSIGSCRLWRVPKTTTDKVRLRVTAAAACPALSDFGLLRSRRSARGSRPSAHRPRPPRRSDGRSSPCHARRPTARQPTPSTATRAPSGTPSCRPAMRAVSRRVSPLTWGN